MNGLLEKIDQLEKVARELEPGQNQRISLRSKIMEATDDFLENLSTMPAYIGPSKYSIDGLKGEFEEPMQEDKVLKEINDTVDLAGINPASGNHLGYVPGGGLFTSALADYWADVTNRYSGIFFANPGAVKIENELIRWIIKLIGYPQEAWGNLTSGGSIANLTAIVAAREAMNIGPDNIGKAVIYITDQTHHCITKALRIAGLHYATVRKVPLDTGLKMDPIEFEKLVKADVNIGNKPFLVVSSAGTTDTGVIDPIREIDQIARNFNIWHHVDAAYGGFFLLTDNCSKELKYMCYADSIVMDPHKSLFLPYGLGVVVVKNRQFLFKAFSYHANYMQDAVEDEKEISPADVSPELTKHFRGLRMWLPLKLYGIKPFKAALEEKHYLAIYLFEELNKINGFEVYKHPELSILMFRFTSTNQNVNDFNKKLVQEIHADGRIFLSSTSINEEFWLRAAILVFRTHKETIDLTLQILKEKVIYLNEMA